MRAKNSKGLNFWGLVFKIIIDHEMQSSHQATGPSTGQFGSSRETNSKDCEKILTYEQYQTRGRQVKALIDANPIRDKIVKPRGLLPVDKRTESASILDGYTLEHYCKNHLFDENNRDEWLPLSFLRIPYNTQFIMMQWWTKTPAPRGSTEYPRNVNKSYYNADHGIIIMASMYAKHDGWPTGAPEKNCASEITWQSWKEVAGRGSANLKFVIQENIQNQGTLKVIEEAYRSQIPPLGKPNAIFGLNGNQAERDAFFALLGTDNARPVEYMLKDHFVEVGRKKIQKIRLFRHKGFLRNKIVGIWFLKLDQIFESLVYGCG
jgi:hypothetical protein